MIASFRSTSLQLPLLAIAALAIAACGRESKSAASDTATADSSNSTASASDTSSTVRGTVASVSDTTVVVAASTGNVTVKTTQPFKVFARQAGKLADVKDNVFIGVTTVKQPDGTEQATEIHIFPEELRGLGEGSRMMNQNASGGSGSRMTNGAVSGSRMTNGTASQSRMSNGNVTASNGSTLVVQYKGGSQQVTVPANAPVTEIKATTKKLATGDQVVLLASKAPDGSLSASTALLSGK
ncbi:MAG: hypothetical protein ACREMS_07390 [Gemmatimonadaceae bacterium]